MDRKVCVVPGCISQLREKEHDGHSPYCSSYHEKLDSTHHFAALKGYFYVEGAWGPPWPHLLQPSCQNCHTDEIWDFVSEIPLSPDIGVELFGLDEHIQEGEEEVDVVDLTPHSENPPLVRTISPKVEMNDGVWQMKTSFTKRKTPESIMSFEAPEWSKRSRVERNQWPESRPNDHNSTETRRKLPSSVLSLQYKSTPSYSRQPPKQTIHRQVNIGEYLRRK
jgi:hypothetical protein